MNVQKCEGCEQWYCVNCDEISECPRCSQCFCVECYVEAESHACAEQREEARQRPEER